MATLYDILKVEVSASPREIRAAYLRLMKERHPDRGPEAHSGPDAAAINSAYAVLSDPGRRTAYDQSLRSKRGVALAIRAPPERATTPPEKGLSRFLMLSVVGVLVLALASITFTQLVEPAGERIGSFNSHPGLSSVDREPQSFEQPPVNELLVADAFRAAITTEPVLARSLSRRCFQVYSDDPRYTALDFCVALDASVIGWHPQLENDQQLGSYFGSSEQERRHLAALERLSTDEEANEVRLSAIQNLVTSLIAQHIIALERARQERLGR